MKNYTDGLATMIYYAIHGNGRSTAHQNEKLGQIREWLKDADTQELSIHRLIHDWIKYDADQLHTTE